MRRTYSGARSDKSRASAARGTPAGAATGVVSTIDEAFIAVLVGCYSPLINGCRVGAQQFEKRRLLAQLDQSRRDRRIGRMAFEVHKEKIFPKSRARRSRFEPRHRDAI